MKWLENKKTYLNIIDVLIGVLALYGTSFLFTLAITWITVPSMLVGVFVIISRIYSLVKRETYNDSKFR
jgi:CHASE2 domain-containing sensor protein